jgi:heme/copper-type cytochrome/quinol oxidase subunit 1
MLFLDFSKTRRQVFVSVAFFVYKTQNSYRREAVFMQTGYLLPGNQKQQTLKRLIKFTAIIFILIMLMSSLSGCVELEHGESASENPILWWDESSEQYKTQLHPGVPNNSNEMPRPDVFKRTVKITPSHPILLKFGDRVHTGLLREVCIIMHNSIFSEDLRYAYENDHLVDADNIKILSLEPA